MDKWEQLKTELEELREHYKDLSNIWNDELGNRMGDRAKVVSYILSRIKILEED